MKQLQIQVSRPKIEDFCRRWKIVEFSFFGSVLREDFHSGSDIDVLVEFASHSSWGLFDLVKMQEELSQLLNRPVDLISKKAITTSSNWIRRQNILKSAEIYYAA